MRRRSRREGRESRARNLERKRENGNLLPQLCIETTWIVLHFN
jgi:hypothetical protein